MLICIKFFVKLLKNSIMSYSTLNLEYKDNYVIVNLNRPDKLNALNDQMFNDLDAAFASFELDNNVKAVIVTGTGEKAFAAGADIKELHECGKITGKIFSEKGQSVFNRIERLGKPVIAAVNGFALGGGCELAMACHIRFASENAKFGQPEVNLGIIPGYGGTQRLTRLVGIAKSIELTISGNLISATEAEKIGLANSVHPLENLMEYTENFVKTVLSKGAIAVSGALDAILAQSELSPLEGLLFEAKKFGEICGTDDFKEGTSAFLEKRKANFKN